MRLRGKVALVTGGGSGIGRETALLFAREGARIALVDVHAGAAQETAAAIAAEGGEALALCADVTDEQAVRQAVDRTVDHFGGIHILFNCAGVETLGTVCETAEADWDRVMAVNVKGTFLMSKYAIPAMARAGGGSVINVASVAGLVGIPRMAAYCAAKGAIVNLTRNMAVDFARQGVRVNCVAPGTTLTPMGRRLVESDTDPEKQRQRLAKYPLGRFGNPSEIAAAVLFLASDESSFVTGSCLTADGGMTAW